MLLLRVVVCSFVDVDVATNRTTSLAEPGALGQIDITHDRSAKECVVASAGPVDVARNLTRLQLDEARIRDDQVAFDACTASYVGSLMSLKMRKKMN